MIIFFTFNTTFVKPALETKMKHFSELFNSPLVEIKVLITAERLHYLVTDRGSLSLRLHYLVTDRGSLSLSNLARDDCCSLFPQGTSSHL